jgi:diguanylate cyclase (GGDEF)-like protein/PAS domain S-box-containing protein
MKKTLGKEMEFFRQYNKVLFNQLEQKILDIEAANHQLRISVEESRLQFKNISDVVFITGTDFNILSISPSVKKLLGYKAEDFIGRSASDLRHIFTSESFERATANISKLLKGERIPATIYEFVAKDGTIKHVEIHGSPLIRYRKVTGTISVARDITERKRAEESLKETELKFRTIFDSASDGILLLNVGDGKFSDANEKICKMLGYTRKELLNLSIPDIHPQESVPFVIDQSEKQLKKEILIAKNIPVLKKDKTVFFADISSSPITLSEKEYLLGMFRDITERKQVEDMLKESEKKYRELSIIDDLTQLYNSRYFHAQLEIEIVRSNRYGQPLTLLLLDIDKFKKFNDKYGHVDGDYVLLRLGQVVKRCLRETDSAYRYGGEEFTIMLPMTTSEEGLVTAKRIQKELRKENFYPELGQEINITVSIGLAQYKPKEEMKAFVHQVDQLMYQAKSNGRDRICPES